MAGYSRQTWRLWVLGGVLALPILAALCQGALAAAHVAEIIGINGQVESRLGGRGFAPAALLQRLAPPDAVRTLAASKAKLSFIDRSITVLGEKTTLEISQYRLGEAAGGPLRALRVVNGKVRLIVHTFFGTSAAEPEVAVETPTLGVGIRGTDIIFAVQGPTDTVYLLQAGKPVSLRSKSTGEQVELRPGYYAISQAGRPLRLLPLTDDLRRQLLKELNLAFEVRPLGVPIEPDLPPPPPSRTAPGVGPTEALPPVYAPPIPAPPAAPHGGHY